MKTKKLLTLLIFFALGLSSCKKDHPKDIPQWIKDKIKKCKRKSCCYGQYGSLKILELINKNDGSLIYEFYGTFNPSDYDYYNYDGNRICFTIPVWGVGDSCSKNIKTNYTFSRDIWRENPDKCR